MAVWKKVIVSGSNAELNALLVSNSITASIFSGSAFTGSLFGTASYAINGGGAGNNIVGITTLDFGSAPGTNTATTTVTTAAVNNNSSINIYIMSTASLNHNAEDHQVFALYSKVIPTNIIDNTSFDIVGISDLRINGEFKVKYNIIN